DRSVEPRLAQVFVPLLSVIEDAAARQSLRELMQGYHRIISNTCASMYIPRSATSSRNAAIVIGTCNSIDWLRSRTASPSARYLDTRTDRFSLIKIRNPDGWGLDCLSGGHRTPASGLSQPLHESDHWCPPLVNGATNGRVVAKAVEDDERL